MDIWETDRRPASFWDAAPYAGLWEGPPGRSHKRLSRSPEVVTALLAAFQSDPQTAGQLVDLYYTPPPEYTAHTFLFGTWKASGTPVIVKLDADPWEQYWMSAIDRAAPGLVSRVFAGGERIGAHPLRWLALQRLPYALSHDWGERMYDLLAASAARFQQAARGIETRYTGLVSLHSTRASLQQAIREDCPGPLQRVLDRLDADWTWVNAHCGQEVCFGDLTMGNAATPAPPELLTAVRSADCAATPALSSETIYLIDPLPRIAPWAYDAAYCQALDANSDVRMIQRMAAARQALGLPVPNPADLERLSTILMAWLGAQRWWSTAFRREDPAWCAQIQRYMEQAA